MHCIGTAIAPTRNRSRTSFPVKHQKWTPDEDARLAVIVGRGESVNWKAAECHFPGKTSQQIFERWTKVLDPSLLKGSWTRQEDEIIITFVRTYGGKNWTKLSKMLPGRIGKQCRERWMNHLDPHLSRGPWTADEDLQLWILHEQFGNSWSKIAQMMPTRADNMVKNRWYATVSKKSKEELAAVAMSGAKNIQTTSLPKPQFEEANAEQPIAIPSLGQFMMTPGFTMTPVRGALPSLGMGSPIQSNGSPFQLLSPYSRTTPIFSPWSSEGPKEVFASPNRLKQSPPSLSENRAELLNLMISRTQ